IDLAVGVALKKKKRDAVRKGETLAVIHANHPEKVAAARKRLAAAYTISKEPAEKPKLIKKIMKEDLHKICFLHIYLQQNDMWQEHET
ncbi:hypothetical protein LI253_16780, partial [Gordonibacter pamelaeae]|nr:hypothetical protein [Gordonibacter pamelaeae]